MGPNDQADRTKTWQAQWAESVGKQMQAVRKARKMTVQGLSKRCSELGYPIPRSTLTNLESGRKEAIVVQELVVIAEALDVSPVELLYPGLPDGQVEYLPGRTARAMDALKNFTGEDKQGRGQRNRFLAMMRAIEQARFELEVRERTSSDTAGTRNFIESARGALIDAGYTVTGPAPKIEIEAFRTFRTTFLDESDNDDV